MNAPFLVIIVPCYNEKEVLPETARRLKEVLGSLKGKDKISQGSTILFVNDGSKDSTWADIHALHSQDPASFSGITFAANRGHQFAVMAGLLQAKEMGADATISIDADLQDDVSVIEEMVDQYRDGTEIVYGVRKKRDTDTFFKRVTAEAYYKILHLMGVDAVTNHADYRLLGKEALDAISEYGETHLFLRGMMPMLGYTTGVAYYDRAPRFAGVSKYPLGKMMGLAVDGITSLSDTPIKLVAYTGIGLTLGGALWGFIAILLAIFGGGVSGTVAIIICMILGFGLTLCALGIVGTYVGKAYIQSKHRPRFRVTEKLLPPTGNGEA